MNIPKEISREITRKCLTGEDFTPEEQTLVNQNAVECIVEDFKDEPEMLKSFIESIERFVKRHK